MQSLFKAVGPLSFRWRPVQLQDPLRSAAALICLFCFLGAVISISDHRFSNRRPSDDGSCKILKGCLDTEDQSRKVAVPLAFGSVNALTTPALQVVALVADLEIFPLKSLLLPAEQGRAPPVASLLNF